VANQNAKPQESAPAGSVYKVGLAVGVICWLILAVLAVGGEITDTVWGLTLGMIFTVVGIPAAVMIAKSDPS
jgi:hypothetical protein